jgi:subtilisin-like proprotein convertase family protein
MERMNGKRALASIGAAIMVLGVAAAPATASTASFSNPAPFDIRTGPAGNADPYPSEVSVSGFSGTTAAVSVRINDFSHTAPDEVGILLRAPNGDSLLLQSGAGDSTDINNLTYTISDGVFPDLPDTGVIAPGTYQPTSYYGASDDYPSPGPGTSYGVPGPSGSGSFAGSFGGDNPNGTWRLFVRDFSGGDGGSIAGGWTLKVTDNSPFAPDNDVFAAAQVVSGSVSDTPGNNSLATRQSNEPDHCVAAADCGGWIGDHSVWYSWTALGSGATSIDTCQSNIDSVLAVYTGDSVGSLSRVADGNNSPECPAGTYGSKVSFDAVAGTTYRIAVGDAGGAREDRFTLRIVGQSAPAVDTIPPETFISSGPRNRTARRDARFRFVSSDLGSTFACSLNGASFQPCSSPTSVRARRGRNIFRVAATDPSGNVDAVPEAFRWRVRRHR